MTRRTALRSAPDAVEPFSSWHDVLARHLPGAGLPWLAERRAAAYARFRAQGLPGPRVEDWRWTPLRHLSEMALTPARLSPAAELHELPTAILPLDGCRLILVNGVLDRVLCDLARLPAGVRVTGLAQELAAHPERLQPWLATVAEAADTPLAALNTASFADGVVIHVGAGVEAAEPLHLVSIGAAVDHAVDFHPRLLVVLEDGARLTLVESHCGVVDQPYVSNSVTEMHLGRGARLDHVKLQDEAPEGWHVALQAVRLAEAAVFRSTVLHAGGRLARHELRVTLAEPHAEAHVNGGYVIDGHAHVDDTVVIDHQAPHCTSRQMWKGVADGRARGVFRGKVRVARGAQKTDAYQMSRALLLSPQAEADGKPELEILADDVKCGHGATVGTLDDEALFYLESRGIPHDEARRLLIAGFLDEVVDTIADHAVRDALRALVERRLR